MAIPEACYTSARTIYTKYSKYTKYAKYDKTADCKPIYSKTSRTSRTLCTSCKRYLTLRETGNRPKIIILSNLSTLPNLLSDLLILSDLPV